MEFIMALNNTDTSIVLNGTFTASEMAEKFNGFARKTAESVLQMAKVVSEMKKQSSAQKDKDEFEKFCDLIGYKSDSSLIRKYTIIGGKFDLLMKNVSKLPSTWTTVYQISMLSNEAIETFIEKGVISPRLSGSNVKDVLGLSKPKESAAIKTSAEKTTVPNGTDDGISFRARLVDFPNAAVREKLKRILAELKDINMEIESSAELDNVLNDQQLELAA